MAYTGLGLWWIGPVEWTFVREEFGQAVLQQDARGRVRQDWGKGYSAAQVFRQIGGRNPKNQKPDARGHGNQSIQYRAIKIHVRYI